MSETIHIDVATRPDELDLADFLDEWGLTTVCTEGEGLEVLGGRHVPAEVSCAIAAWLDERRVPLVPEDVRGRPVVLRPPAD
ncbi:MAG TPA: hypothetical protein VFL41_11330 [Gaiellaceae bacterium]|nr:hypothetical protein [Gaiellaceae bacterium]